VGAIGAPKRFHRTIAGDRAEGGGFLPNKTCMDCGPRQSCTLIDFDGGFNFERPPERVAA